MRQYPHPPDLQVAIPFERDKGTFMLLNDDEIQERSESPLNLMNRLRNASKAISPSLPPPSAKDLIPDLDEKLDKTDIKKEATAIMAAALKELKTRMPDVQKPEKIAQIAEQMNKIITAREDRNEGRVPQVIVYAPQVIQESHFPSLILQEDSQ